MAECSNWDLSNSLMAQIKAPLCTGFPEATFMSFFGGSRNGGSRFSGWGIVSFLKKQSLRQNQRFCHLPLHKGGLFTIRQLTDKFQFNEKPTRKFGWAYILFRG